MKNGLPVGGGDAPAFGANPFAALSSAGLPEGPRPAVGTGAPAGKASPRRDRGRVDIVREKAGRAGKTVTVLRGFVGISLQEKEEIAREIRRRCGTGGAVKDGQIEVQGDRRDEAAAVLEQWGFRPVRAGG